MKELDLEFVFIDLTRELCSGLREETILSREDGDNCWVAALRSRLKVFE